MDREPTIPVDSRVVLRGQMEVVYPVAWAGSEGWVREVKWDEDGFERVWIQWDREHWRYSGEEDLWTFASHFRAIDGPGPDRPYQTAAEVAEAYAEAEADGEAMTPCPDCGDFHVDEDPQWQEYYDTLTKAADTAADTDNFALLTIASPPEDPDGAPVPILFMHTLKDGDALRLYAQMSALATRAMRALVHDKLTEN
jgi:hypothetical protein